MSKPSTNSHYIAEEDILNICGLEDASNEYKSNFSAWFTGKDGANKDVILSRQQAAQSYPLIAFRMSQNKKICDVIEQKKSLIPALAEFYNVDKKALKRIQGKNKFDLGIKSRDYIYDVIKLKEKHFQQLKNNLADLNILDEYAICLYDMSIHEFLDTLSLDGQNPCQHIERMKENSVYDVKDAFDFLQTRLFIPAILNKSKIHAEKNNFIVYDRYTWTISKEMVKKHTHFKTIFDFSERYHRNLFRWEDMFSFDSGIKHISWQPMFGEIDLGNGWSAREIHSVAALKEQGRRENHCVGGYFKAILKNNKESARLIFSLEKDGKIKSTIDMLCSKNENGDRIDAEIQQNRAHSNKNPCEETLNFSHLLLRKIKNEPVFKLNIYLDNLKDASQEYQKYKNENEYVEGCGYNPWNREILENVWDEFKPVLPAKLRRGGLDEFIDMMPLNDVDFRVRKNSDQLNPWDMMENKEQDQRKSAEENVEIIL